MADLGGTFDPNSVPDQRNFDMIPPGKYPVTITQSEMRETKNGAGKYLWLEMQITGGEYQGRLLWDRLNLVNANPQAVEIAQQSLGAICKAIGLASCSDSEQLHMKPRLAIVKVKPAQGQYEASNEVKGYEPAGGSVTQMATTKAFQPASATKTPPWKKAAAE